ncbi:hypothetical protein [Winogradskyella bathintestinalis]|uniref:DUF3108 domain-containing protein n=1 Tax=Winogradskyella bathintestinalis TaxID=3035208 RepID=A0ABT7ZRX0_9FLAO|nr:hypothetical protein [Winogradskyella bathintestinalis]MDN3491733.1 hypothetical protein [Winogradskyella bathintestinalis]
MKNSIFILFILLSLKGFSQDITVDGNFRFEFKKAIKNSRHFEVHNSGYFVQANKNQKKIQVRFKIKSKSKKKEYFDPNKFYLVSDEYKQRLRPVDMKHNHAMGTFLGFKRLIDEKPKDKKTYWYSYKPSTKDSFVDYKIDGYEDVDNCINFGTERRPKIKSIYFDYKKIKSNTVDIYFIVPKNFKRGKIYFGNELLKEFNVK